MNKTYVGDGKVVLIAGGGRIFTDIAARFCDSERGLDEILASPHTKGIVKNIIENGHLAATEFDDFIFGIEGYARVTEVQLVRKRLASYLIKSGRKNKEGKRSFDIVMPSKDIEEFSYVHEFKGDEIFLDPDLDVTLEDGLLALGIGPEDFQQVFPNLSINDNYTFYAPLNSTDLLNMIEGWYNTGVEEGFPEEELRYMKPQATEFKALIKMNKHALHDWFMIRMCLNAQTEIRDLATKMFNLGKEAAPELFENDGASCKVLGYCPENGRQHPNCKGKIITKREAMKVLKEYQKNLKLEK